MIEEMTTFPLSNALNANALNSEKYEPNEMLERELEILFGQAHRQCLAENERIQAIDRAEFLAYIGSCIAQRDELELKELKWADLYLAFASSMGDNAAIELIEKKYGAEVSRGIAKLGVSESMIEEIKQRLREQLYVGLNGKPPYITHYSGYGRLGAWMKVIATRLALKQLHRDKREEPTSDEELILKIENVVEDEREPELVRLLYADHFKSAFRSAIQTIDRDQRRLLWKHHVDGMTIDQLGIILNVHRSTAARRVDRARQLLLQEIRKTVMQRFSVSSTTCDSLMRMMHHHIDLSIRCILE